MGEGVAEEAAMRSVTSTAGPAQLGQRDRPRGPSTRRDSAVPHRAHAEQGQGLGHVVALGAHRAPCPTAPGRPCRGRSPVSARWRSTQARRPARRPTSHASGDGMRLADRRSRSCARSAARGRRRGSGAPLGPGRHVAAVEPGEQVVDLVGGAAAGRDEPVGTPTAASGVVVGGVATPAAAGQALDAVAAGGLLDRVERRRRVEIDAELGGHRGPQRRHVALGQAGDGQHGVDQRLARRAAARACAGRRGSGRPSARTGSRRRGTITSSNSSASGTSLDAEVAVAGRRRRAAPRRCSRSAGSLAGSRLWTWRTRRAAARAGPGRRRCRPASSAAGGGRSTTAWARRLAWVPSPGSFTTNG